MTRNDKCQEANNISFMIENMLFYLLNDNPHVYLPCSCTNALELETGFPQRAWWCPYSHMSDAQLSLLPFQFLYSGRWTTGLCSVAGQPSDNAVFLIGICII